MKLSKHRREGEFDRSQNMLITVSMKARKQGIKPWEQSPLGQHGFDPIGITTCLVFKTMRQLSFDELVDYLKASPKLLESLHLKKVPSRSALHASFSRIREDFITWMINSISRPGMKGTLYGDSTGFAINGQRTWLDAKSGLSSRRDYRKLHIVRAKNGTIISHIVTD
ncbi:MAG: hypothetical protein K8823_9 [Cenarchaeum symbiont of Oopsacas minuta]|nr:hypothetical protein [Cenarchaeum symbiont of Oopsacas minuta]